MAKKSNMALYAVGAGAVVLLVMATGAKASASVGIGTKSGMTVEKGSWWEGKSGRIYVGYGDGEAGLTRLKAENPEGFDDVKKRIAQLRRAM